MPSEFDFIREIQRKAAAQSAADLVLGIGDDAAIWREQAGRESLITVDLLVEDVDFKLEYAPPRWLGAKALAVSLSDIAAMGAEPKFSLLTLSIPKPNLQSEEFWEEFFAGYFALAEVYGVRLVGGDISSAPDRLSIDSIVIGMCQTGKSVKRSGAKVGDAVYMTGSVGASASGLKLLLSGERVDETLFYRRDAEEAQSEWKTFAPSLRSLCLCGEEGSQKTCSDDQLKQSAICAHLCPEPRVEFGRRLGELGLANSMIDVSDGLAQDLGHICESSGVSAVINFEAVPVAKEVTLVTASADEAFEFAVSGGEDFELLFTADQSREAELMALAAECQLRLTWIGELMEGSTPAAVQIRRNGEVKPLSIRGYDHFGV